MSQTVTIQLQEGLWRVHQEGELIGRFQEEQQAVGYVKWLQRGIEPLGAAEFAAVKKYVSESPCGACARVESGECAECDVAYAMYVPNTEARLLANCRALEAERDAAVQRADAWAQTAAKAMDARVNVEKERDDLRKEVREWLCDTCNTVYPGPPTRGFDCVQCPKCLGNTSPRMWLERNQHRRRADLAEGRLHDLQLKANVIKGNVAIGCMQLKDWLDFANAVLYG